MSAWGHAIRSLTPDEIAEQERRNMEYVEHGWPPDARLCVMRRCPNVASFAIAYLYVTGRAGRVTHAEKKVCDKHAAGFRKKYKPREGVAA